MHQRVDTKLRTDQVRTFSTIYQPTILQILHFSVNRSMWACSELCLSLSESMFKGCVIGFTSLSTSADVVYTVLNS